MLEMLCAILCRLFFFTGAVRDEGSYPRPLSGEDEEKYLSLARGGDKNARDTLIRHNMRLVAHVVKKYTGAAETDDMISVGSIGLIKAIDSYEPSRGTRLATYTARCIENEILMFIRAGKKNTRRRSLCPIPSGRTRTATNSRSWIFFSKRRIRCSGAWSSRSCRKSSSLPSNAF